LCLCKRPLKEAHQFANTINFVPGGSLPAAPFAVNIRQATGSPPRCCMTFKAISPDFWSRGEKFLDKHIGKR